MSQHIDPTPLQTDVKALNDSLTIKNVTYTSAGGTVGGYAKMFGNVVAGNIYSTGKSCPQGTYTTIATISHPPTFDSMYAPVYSANDGSFVGMGRINVNGNVEIYANVATTTPALSFAYIRQ